MRQFKRYDSPTGVMGFGDLGVMRVGRVDPDVEKLLMPFRKNGFRVSISLTLGMGLQLTLQPLAV
jgi:hypothetical protein